MNDRRILVVAALGLCAALWTYACGDGATEPPPPPNPPRPATVAVNPATAELTALGATVQLSAEVRDQNGQVMAGATVTWSSGGATAATVSTAGLVTAVADGTATITATAGSASGSATVSVARKISTVAVTPAEASIVALGDTVRLAAEALDANGNAVAGAEFEWESSNDAVATVDAAGLVTAVDNGTAEVTATSTGVTGSAALTIEAAVPTTVTVTPETLHLISPGETLQLAAEVRDQNGQAMSGVSVMWASSDDRTARVDEMGLVKGIAGGAATITAMAGEASGTTVIRVIDMEWAADFVARTHVVDAVLNFGMRVDPNCTAVDCERSRFPGDGSDDFGTFKAVTGVDMAVRSISAAGLSWMMRRRDAYDDGRYANGRLVQTYADIEAAHAENDLAVMFYVQRRSPDSDWQLDGDVANLRRWYDGGLRILQISYGHTPPSSPDAHTVDERLGYGHREGEEKGVTDLGRLAIAEMNALGMIVDVSHSSRQTTLDAAALSTKPILVTHATAEALTPISRTKDDDELIAIAATGGVIGVTNIGWQLDTDGDGKGGMEDFIAHVEYIAALVGIDHVGVSADSYVDGWPLESRHYSDVDLSAPDRWVRLTARLRARGWTEKELAKLLGGNFLRVFREVLRPQ